MEMTQKNSLYSYLYLKQAKMSFFFFLFSSTKSENRSVEQVLWWGLVPMGGGYVAGERV
jgi:hypothetical protein